MKKRETLSKIKVIAESLIPADQAPAKTMDSSQPSWIPYVAMLTGALAAITGFLTVRMGVLTNDAIYESNQAVLSQTEASDAWAEYQADSIKARIVEVQLLPSNKLSPQDRETLIADDKELRGRQPAIKKNALSKLEERKQHLEHSNIRLGQKDMLGYASMVAQLGIAIASVAALTKRRDAFYAGIAAGGVTIIITVWSLLGGHL